MKDCDQDGVYKWCIKVASVPLPDKGLETPFLLISLDEETELVIDWFVLSILKLSRHML